MFASFLAVISMFLPLFQRADPQMETVWQFSSAFHGARFFLKIWQKILEKTDCFLIFGFICWNPIGNIKYRISPLQFSVIFSEEFVSFLLRQNFRVGFDPWRFCIGLAFGFFQSHSDHFCTIWIPWLEQMHHLLSACISQSCLKQNINLTGNSFVKYHKNCW